MSQKASCQAALAGALERLVTRLRYNWRILFEKAWDYAEGLDAATINKLVADLGQGPIFELASSEERRVLTVRHPDDSKPSIVWTIWSGGWEHHDEVLADKATACHAKPKFTDTLECLGRWRAAAQVGFRPSVETRPDSPAPPEPDVVAAMRDVAPVLADMESTQENYAPAPAPGHRIVLHRSLVRWLNEVRGHGKAAAEWAIHRLVEQGVLSASCGYDELPSWQTREGTWHLGERYEIHEPGSCLIGSTDELWKRWHEEMHEPSQKCTPHHLLARWPLVRERTGRQSPSQELAKDENRERQARHCQGFDPDWWLPALAVPKWKSYWYPLTATKESVEQWLNLIKTLRLEYLGPCENPERAAQLDEEQESDLDLIRQHAPQVYEAVKGRSPTPPPTKPAEEPASPSAPNHYLLSWREITDALEQRNNEEMRRRLRELNEQFDGPIILPKQGAQPKVTKAKLLQWWEQLEEQFRAAEQKSKDTEATLKAQHHHGRDGRVLPGIAGHVQKRRRKNKG